VEAVAILEVSEMIEGRFGIRTKENTP